MKNHYRIILSFIFIFCSIHLHAQLTGTKTIGGTGADYPTINTAVSDLVAKGVGNGGVVFKIRPGIYTERILIPAIIGSSATNTITFESETQKAEDVVVTSAGGNTVKDFHTVKLYGCMYVILQNLTIQNVNNSIAAALWLSGGYTWDASGKAVANNVIQKCHIKVSDSSDSETIAGIVCSGNTFDMGSASAITQDNTIINNRVTGGYYGIRGVQLGTRNLIKANHITNFYYCGIYLQRFENVRIEGNYIDAFRNDGNNREVYGIYMSDQIASSLHCNNMINLKSGEGMEVCGIYGSGIKVYYNSIYIHGQSALSYAVYGIQSELMNNQLVNYSGGSCYNLEEGPIYPNPPSVSNYNNLYTTGSGLAVYNGKTYNSLVDLQVATDQDTNSLSVLPCFVSELDLHTFNIQIDGKGTPLTDVIVDIDGEQREILPGTKTDIGADEFTSPNIDLAIVQVTVPGPFISADNEVIITLKNQGLQSLQGKTIKVSYTIDNGNTWSPAEEFVATKLTDFDDDETYTFQHKFELVKGGFYTILARVEPPGLADDVNPLNDLLGTDICAPIAGLIRLGNASQPGIDFSSIRDFAELLECAGIYDTVIAEILPGTYTERVYITPYKGMENFPVYFRSSTGNPDDVMIQYEGSGLNDAYNATFTLIRLMNFHVENLSFKNTQTEGNVTCMLLFDMQENCSLKGNRLSLPLNGKDENTTVLQGSGKMDMLITENSFIGGHCGVSLSGQDVLFEKNLVKDAVLGVRISGTRIYVFNNTIDISVSQSLSFGWGGLISHFYGVWVNGGEHNRVENNNIRLDGQAAGINCFAPNTRIINNMISGYLKNNHPFSYGIRLAKSGAQVHFNTVHILSPAEAACVRVWGGNEVFTDVQLTNNIFSHSGGGHALKVDEGGSITYSDYNNLYTTGGFLAYWDQDLENLPELQAHSGMDQSSLSLDPLFASLSDLHVTNMALADKGLETDEITNDIDGEMRCIIKPDIGADEFSDCMDVTADSLLLSGNLMAGQPQEITLQLSNTGRDILSNFNVQYTVEENSVPVAQVTELYTQAIQPGESKAYTFTATWTPPAAATYQVCGMAEVTGDVFTLYNYVCDEVNIVSVGITGNVAETIRVYPNPVKDRIHIQTAGSSAAGLTMFLYDCLNRQVLAVPPSGSPEQVVDLSFLPQGIYLFRFMNENASVYASGKFVKVQ